jgi:hypothetical protein
MNLKSPSLRLLLSLVMTLMFLNGSSQVAAETIVLRVAPYTNSALTRAIGDNAEPSEQEVAAGDSLYPYVRQKCGERNHIDETVLTS